MLLRTERDLISSNREGVTQLPRNLALQAERFYLFAIQATKIYTVGNQNNLFQSAMYDELTLIKRYLLRRIRFFPHNTKSLQKAQLQCRGLDRPSILTAKEHTPVLKLVYTL